MAKKSHAAGPGTAVRGGVHGTLDAPFKGGTSKGSQKNLSGTFDAARSGGDNGLPTRVTDPTGGPKAGGTGPATSTSAPGTILTESKGRK
jgi:hypothetical protein